MKPPVIVGAGLAGLIAGHAWPSSQLVEASPQPRQAHNALLRFRSDAIGRLTGIEFKQVRVRKGIWSDGEFRQPNIQITNKYSNKVLGKLVGDRSIWNIDACDRWIAPETFYEQLIEATAARITWSSPFDFAVSKEPVISTAPLPITLKACGTDHKLKFERSPITVIRCRVADADVYQTVYFPDQDTSVYRISITGSLMIIEAAKKLVDGELETALFLASEVFDAGTISVIDTVEQKYGKIAPVDDTTRKQLLFRLTHERKIYSLGRFGCWRNILLDDLIGDIDVLKRLLRSDSYFNKMASI